MNPSELTDGDTTTEPDLGVGGLLLEDELDDELGSAGGLKYAGASGPTLDRRQGLQNARVVCVVSAVVSHSMMRQELKPQTRASNERTESKPMMKRVALLVLGMLVHQSLVRGRRLGLQNVQAACVVHIAAFQAQTMQESRIQTKASKEKEESQQKMRTWTMTLRGRQEEEWLPLLVVVIL